MLEAMNVEKESLAKLLADVELKASSRDKELKAARDSNSCLTAEKLTLENLAATMEKKVSLGVLS